MSTPPPNYPPQGPSYYAPPPPPKSSGNGCLKAAGITCGVLLVLFIIGGVLTFNAVKNQMKNPNGILAQGMKIATEEQTGQQIQQAIVAYKSENGHYPPTLAALYPKYVTSNTTFHSQFDTNPSPYHVSWQYIKPSQGAPPNSPLLTLPYTMTIEFGGKKQSVPGVVTITLDGHILTHNSRTGGYEQSGPGQ